MAAAAAAQGKRVRRWRSGARQLAIWAGAVLMLGSALLGASLPVQAQISSAEEYKLKLAFLYNFAKFVEWPADSFPSPQAPLYICIIGRDPFDNDLEQQVSERSVNGHRSMTHRVRPGDDLSACHIIFLPASSDNYLPVILKQVEGSPAITVGESAGFASRGGTVNFVMEDTRLRFEVNLSASQRARSRISSRLLSLARIVRE
jgi:uncharacterized protein DUF4154